jgi:two-component system, NtrC family, response regulator GlrR
VPSPPLPHTRLLNREGASIRLLRGCAIEVIAGPAAGKRCRVEQLELRIGSHPANDLVLADDTVSRHHLDLRVVPDGYRLTDRGSANGTRLGNHRIGDVTIVGAVTLRLGRSVLRLTPLEEEREIPASSAQRFGTLVGRSVIMRELFWQLEAVARSDCSVLIEGETGVGKEETARSLHRASPRAGGPFVVVDCGAVSGELMESELFGHARGAFTGAATERAGLAESADGGTLFLDEVGELPVPLQLKLLGVLERRTLSRVGSSTPVPLDVRVLAATHRDLSRDVDRGRFRSDLFYRLAVVRVRVPPLRERLDDLPLLVATLLADLGERHGEAVPRELSAVALARLGERAWPGNVRELRNVLERAVLAAPGQPPALDHFASYAGARDEFIGEFERRFLLDALTRNAFSVRQTAEAVQIDQRYLRRLLQRHQIVARNLKLGHE